MAAPVYKPLAPAALANYPVIAEITQNYTVEDWVSIILVDASATAITVTVPADRSVYVKKIDSNTANPVTILPGSGLISGVASVSITVSNSGYETIPSSNGLVIGSAFVAGAMEVLKVWQDGATIAAGVTTEQFIDFGYTIPPNWHKPSRSLVLKGGGRYTTNIITAVGTLDISFYQGGTLTGGTLTNGTYIGSTLTGAVKIGGGQLAAASLGLSLTDRAFQLPDFTFNVAATGSSVSAISMGVLSLFDASGFRPLNLGMAVSAFNTTVGGRFWAGVKWGTIVTGTNVKLDIMRFAREG